MSFIISELCIIVVDAELRLATNKTIWRMQISASFNCFKLWLSYELEPWCKRNMCHRRVHINVKRKTRIAHNCQHAIHRNTKWRWMKCTRTPKTLGVPEGSPLLTFLFQMKHITKFKLYLLHFINLIRL